MLPVATRYFNTSNYYLKNIQGDVTALIDYLGNIVGRYTYDPWGNIESITGQYNMPNPGINSPVMLNPIRYRSYYYDIDTGFYWLNSRYYDPEIGRFINADGELSGVGGDIRGYNLYTYCFNNPVNMSDPSGNWPRWITASVAVVATAVAVVATVVAAGPTVIAAAASVAVVSTAAYIAQSHHYDKRKAKNVDLPKNADAAELAGWKSSENPKNPQAVFHQYTSSDKSNVKYVSPDGHREAIYDSNNQIVLDSRDIGTYNFVPSGTFWGDIGHTAFDVLPWFLFGNDDDDPGPLINEIIRLFE